MTDRHMTEQPARPDGAAAEPAGDAVSAELTRFIHALERSGGDANVLRVERALKIAIPITCLIIALFGAPLATSTQRGGTAYGIGVSLATTIIFLLMIQLTKAVGGKGVIPPDLAAWLPNAHVRRHRDSCCCARAHVSELDRPFDGPVVQPTETFPVVQRTGIRFFRRVTRASSTSSRQVGARGYFLRDIGRALGDPATFVPETIRQMQRIGVDSIPLTVIVAAFIGGVIAIQTRYQLFPGVQLSIIGLVRAPDAGARAGPAAHGARAHGPRRRADDGGDRDDARHRADRRARDAGVRSGRVSHRAAAARGVVMLPCLVVLADATGLFSGYRRCRCTSPT